MKNLYNALSGTWIMSIAPCHILVIIIEKVYVSELKLSLESLKAMSAELAENQAGII